MRRGLALAAVAACMLRAAVASGTVYTWIEDGTRHFTNSAHEIPEPHRAKAGRFPTAPPSPEDEAEDAAPAAHAPAATATAGTASAATADVHLAPDALEAAFGRGVERGAALALAQTRAVGEVAASLLEATLQRPAAPSATAPVVQRPARERPAFRVSIVPGSDRWPGGGGYGWVGASAGCPACCCAAGFGYGFGFGRLVPHSHFFPSLAGARRSPLFFPDGHQLDANLFLVGRGYWVD